MSSSDFIGLLDLDLFFPEQRVIRLCPIIESRIIMIIVIVVIIRAAHKECICMCPASTASFPFLFPTATPQAQMQIHRHKTFFHSWSRCVFLSLCVSCIYSYDKKAFQSFTSLFYDPANGFGAFLDDEKLFLRHTKSSVSGFFKRGLAEKWLCFKYNNKSRLKDGMENRRGEKPPTHVTGEDNFIIHSRKVFFFFRFLLVLLFSPVRRLQSQSQPTDESQST